MNEDEISLVDLWLVLVRRRFILVATVLASVLAGGLFAFLRPPTYAFTTTIQIGRVVELSGPGEMVVSVIPNESIEPPEAVVAKINEGYIPKVLSAYVDEVGQRTAPEIEASSPNQSQLVLIKSKASEKESEVHIGLHKKIMETILADHAILIANFTKSLEFRLAQASRKYESLSDEGRVLVNRVKLLDDTQVLLEKQIGEIQDLTSTATSVLERAQSEVGDEAKALTFLMVSNEIQRNRNRLATLKERLNIGLPSERNDLEKELADVERGMTTQQQISSAIETRLSAVWETRLLVGPARSLRPVGPGRAVILALAGVLGLILGVIAAFFAEFLAKARAAW